jgi:hypothetical protein
MREKTHEHKVEQKKSSTPAAESADLELDAADGVSVAPPTFQLKENEDDKSEEKGIEITTSDLVSDIPDPPPVNTISQVDPIFSAPPVPVLQKKEKEFEPEEEVKEGLSQEYVSSAAAEEPPADENNLGSANAQILQLKSEAPIQMVGEEQEEKQQWVQSKVGWKQVPKSKIPKSKMWQKVGDEWVEVDKPPVSAIHLPEFYKDEEIKRGWRGGKKESNRNKTDHITKYYSPEEQTANELLPNQNNRLIHPTGHLAHTQNSHIYAMSPDGNIIMNPLETGTRESGEDESGSLQIRETHHSTMFAGGDVAHASHIRLAHGKIGYLDDDSGHYKPKEENTWGAFKSMNKRGLLDEKGKIMLVNKGFSKSNPEWYANQFELDFWKYSQTEGNEKQARNKESMLEELMRRYGAIHEQEEDQNNQENQNNGVEDPTMGGRLYAGDRQYGQDDDPTMGGRLYPGDGQYGQDDDQNAGDDDQTAGGRLYPGLQYLEENGDDDQNAGDDDQTAGGRLYPGLQYLEENGDDEGPYQFAKVDQNDSENNTNNSNLPIFQLKSDTVQFAEETGSDDFPAYKPNSTGLPDDLKSGIENLSGYSLDDVNVHYNSSKPAQLQAHAYAQGTDIHVASGQERHLPHEAWHVVQQKQGRVQPTMQMKGKVNVNDDEGLEKEADVMGAKAASQFKLNSDNKNTKVTNTSGDSNVAQGKFIYSVPIYNERSARNEQKAITFRKNSDANAFKMILDDVIANQLSHPIYENLEEERIIATIKTYLSLKTIYKFEYVNEEREDPITHNMEAYWWKVTIAKDSQYFLYSYEAWKVLFDYFFPASLIEDQIGPSTEIGATISYKDVDYTDRDVFVPKLVEDFNLNEFTVKTALSRMVSGGKGSKDLKRSGPALEEDTELDNLKGSLHESFGIGANGCTFFFLKVDDNITIVAVGGHVKDAKHYKVVYGATDYPSKGKFEFP